MATIRRVTRSKEEARQSYNKISRWYDFFTNSEKKFTDLGLEILGPQSGETLLEIGFGTGYALSKLAHYAYPATIYGVDLSEKMCLRSKKKLHTEGLGKSVNLQQGDAAHLPYKKNSFDAIFISFTLELFDIPDIPLVLGECQRVLKRNGRLELVTLRKRECRAVRVYEWFHQAMPKLVDCRPIYPKESLENAGFQIQKSTETKMWGLPVSILCAQKKTIAP